jgi:hypothetical protein
MDVVQQVKFYPLDVTLLKKGEWISPSRCEEIHGVKREDDFPRYQLETVKLAKKIEDLSDQTGRLLVCKCERLGIRILEDESNPDYAERTRKTAFRKVLRSQQVLNRTDLNLLTPDGRASWEKGIILGSRMITTLRKIKKGEVPIFAPVESGIPKISEGDVKKRPKVDPADLLPGKISDREGGNE